MVTRSVLASEALCLFRKFNCAQSSFVPFAKHFGLNPEIAFKITTPFGGGIAKSGQVCGAVSGAIMAIGLAHGTITGEKAEKDACHEIVQTFIKRFLIAHGEITCPELLAINEETNKNEAGHVNTRGALQNHCSVFVEDAVLIAAELLKFE